jgi:hypothetical protein
MQNSNDASTVYNQRPWGMPAPTVENQAIGPDQSNIERITGERLQQALIAQAVPPVVQLFRPRFGYRQTELGLSDVLNVDVVYPPPNVGSWYAGGPSETNSSPTYSNLSQTFGQL